MGIHGLHHLVLLVDDVPTAEGFYRELFDLAVRFREGTVDGEPGTVPEDVGWEVAVVSGVTPTMTFLGRDDFTLAVGAADGAGSEGRVDHVALAVDDETFESITDRAESLGCAVDRRAAHHRTFRDRYGFEWELNSRSPPPRPAFEPLELSS